MNYILCQQDADSMISFLNKSVREHGEKTGETMNCTGMPVIISVEKGNVLIDYAIDAETLMVSEYHEESYETVWYRIGQDYYSSDFYPYLSKLIDTYCPVVFQYRMNPGLSVTVERDGEVRNLSGEDRNILESLVDHILRYWSVAAEYSGSIEDFRYKVTVDDGVVTDTVYVCEGFVVINDRRIDYCNDFGLDGLFTQN